LNRPFVVANETKNFNDGRVAFTEGSVGAVAFFAVFDVNVADPVVILGDEFHWGAVITCDEVTDINIGSVVFSKRKGLFPLLGASGCMSVVAHQELMLVCKLTHALPVFWQV
jgi:hypothetical protein